MFRHLIMFLLSGSGLATTLLNLDKGSKCTWKNATGQCVSIHRCLSNYIDFKDKDFAPICTFEGKEPIICCTDCELVNDTRTLIINPSLGILQKNGQKAHDKCLEYMHTISYPCKIFQFVDILRNYMPEAKCNEIKIQLEHIPASIGGINARRAEFPHMALLGYGDNPRSADWLCGGSVISDRFILTAGHCLSSPSLGSVRFVALGLLKRTDPFDLWEIYNVKREFAYPEYKPPSKYHDIALLETNTKIAFNDVVRPACLHTEGEPQQYVTATGWGALGPRKRLADNMQTVSLSRFEEDECAKFYPPHRLLKNGYNHSTQMCYGDKKHHKDTCEGDSGGPLQSRSYQVSSCVFTILGVTSYGRECGVAISSGMYTRVIYYVPWIESIVWP